VLTGSRSVPSLAANATSSGAVAITICDGAEVL
jgi:hypothetical protein